MKANTVNHLVSSAYFKKMFLISHPICPQHINAKSLYSQSLKGNSYILGSSKWEATPSVTQELFLVLHSWVIPYDAWGDHMGFGELT